MTKPTRDSNLELLRIVAMMFIVLHHFIVHGFQLDKLSGYHHSVFPVKNLTFAYDLLVSNSLFIVGVNLFILISGYFSIRLRVKSVLNLVLICLFYDFLQLFATDLYNTHSIAMHWQPFLGIFTRSGWFITCYMALMILSPAINLAFEKFSTKEKLYGLAGLVVLNFWFGYYMDSKLINEAGYSLMQFIFIYYAGRMIRKFESYFRYRNFYNLLGYLACTGLLSLIVIQQLHAKDYKTLWQLYHYDNPLVVLSAIFLFLTFRGIRIRSRIINWISSSILAVYLIHESPFISEKLYSYIYKTIRAHGHFSMETIYVFLWLFLAIMSGAILIDKIRMLITHPVLNKLSPLIESGLHKIETSISQRCKSTNK